MPQFISKERLGDMLGQVPNDKPKQHAIVRRLVDRGFEVEGLNAEFSPLEAISNVPKSTVEFGKSVYQAIKDPPATVEGLGRVVAGGIRKLIPESLKAEGGVGTENEIMFDNVIDFFQQRYGSKDKAINAIEKDPVGFVSDIASVMSLGGGAVAKTGATIARTAKVGSTAAKIGQQTQRIGSATARASRLLEPGTALKATARKFNQATGISKKASEIAQRITKETIGISKGAERRIARTAGLKESPVSLMNKWGVHGSMEEMVDQLQEILNKTSRAVKEDIAKVAGFFKEDAANKMLNSMKKVFKKRQDLSDKFSRMKESIDTLSKKSDVVGLTLLELNEVKKMSNDVLRFLSEGGKPKGLRGENLAELRRTMRRRIEEIGKKNGVPNIRELNQQIQISKGLRDVISDMDVTTKTRRGLIPSMLSAGVFTSAAFLTQNPAFLAGAVGFGGAHKLMQSPRFRSFLATKLQLLSDGEFKSLENGIKFGKWDKKGRRLVKDFQESFKQIAPELRLVGQVKREAEREAE